MHLGLHEPNSRATYLVAPVLFAVDHLQRGVGYNSCLELLPLRKSRQGASDLFLLLSMAALEALHHHHALSVVPPVDEVRLPVPAVGTVRRDDEGVQLSPISIA